MNVIIEPTIGRVVWFRHEKGDVNGQPLVALIAHVHKNGALNLAVFDADGRNHSRTGIPLWQGDGLLPLRPYAEWMPYQKGQAAKTEALEGRAIAHAVISHARVTPAPPESPSPYGAQFEETPIPLDSLFHPQGP